ncbi:MAG: hypothetical protein LBM27_03745 [Lactobacillaceae bacterium]|nr:hypothetical protein [Lactobacillaceae bacterium]
MEDLRPNFAEIARAYRVDPRTVKRAYQKQLDILRGEQPVEVKRVRASILDEYKEILNDSLIVAWLVCPLITLFDTVVIQVATTP